MTKLIFEKAIPKRDKIFISFGIVNYEDCFCLKLKLKEKVEGARELGVLSKQLATIETNVPIHFEEDKLISIENVIGNENRITQVKAIFELTSNGNLRNTSKYFMNDTWVDGHEVYYKEDPTAKVIFK